MEDITISDNIINDSIILDSIIFPLYKKKKQNSL